MNELHKYATFSIDMLGTPNKINSMFSMGRARVFYKGLNRNRSIIDDDVAEKLAKTIPGTPVIGNYDEESGDFGEHGGKQSAYGFVPLNPNYSWVEENGHEYLEVDVVIWDGRFEEAKSILEDNKSLSMELNPKTIKGVFEKRDDMTCYRITFAEFAGITVLGDDYEPCFEDAGFYSAYSAMVNAYALYIEDTQKNVKGGNDVMENENLIVEPEVTTEEVTAEEVAEETAEVETEVVEETPVEETTEETTEVEEEAAEESETETVETVEEAEADFKKDDEVCPECGENPCVCEEESEDESDDKSDHSCKEEDYAALEAKYSALEEKYNEALNSLNQYTKKEKLEIISKFSTKLENEELINELTNNVDNLTIEEVKSELGNALVEQIAAEETTEEETTEDSNFSLNINVNDNTISNSAWDLVKSYKNNK